MSSKNSPAWDLEQAMTAFQVNPMWYDEYWLRDTNDFTGPQVRRCAKRERHLAIKHAFFDLLATSIRFFRLAKATYPTTNVRFGSEADDDFLHPKPLGDQKTGRRNRVGPSPQSGHPVSHQSNGGHLCVFVSAAWRPTSSIILLRSQTLGLPRKVLSSSTGLALPHQPHRCQARRRANPRQL